MKAVCFVMLLWTTGITAPSPPPTYYLEKGFDFVGNDLGNGPGMTADTCAYNCFFSVAGCKAFSWSQWKGGSCFYKKGRGTIKVDPNVISGVVFPYGVPVKGYPSGNIDYEGNDLSNAPSGDYNGCYKICQNTLGCRAFTWSGFNGGTCWLKSKKVNSYVNEGAMSDEIFPANSEGTCALEENIDYVGNDIGRAHGAKPEDCCSVCMGWNGCVAYSWTNQDGGTCWLKNRKDGVVPKNGVVSAAVRINPYAPSCAIEQRTDYVGNDMGVAPSADKFGCCSICMRTQGCAAFSWKNVNGGLCFLKSKKGSTKPDNEVYSAVI